MLKADRSLWGTAAVFAVAGSGKRPRVRPAPRLTRPNVAVKPDARKSHSSSASAAGTSSASCSNLAIDTLLRIPEPSAAPRRASDSSTAGSREAAQHGEAGAV